MAVVFRNLSEEEKLNIENEDDVKILTRHIIAMHKAGYSDNQISDALSKPLQWITMHRVALGLSSNKEEKNPVRPHRFTKGPPAWQSPEDIIGTYDENGITVRVCRPGYAQGVRKPLIDL